MSWIPNRDQTEPIKWNSTDEEGRVLSPFLHQARLVLLQQQEDLIESLYERLASGNLSRSEREDTEQNLRCAREQLQHLQQ